MSDVRVIEIKKSILEENEKKAILLKETLKDEDTLNKEEEE